MPKFSETSKTRLNTAHRDLQTIFKHVILEYDCTVICGTRDREDQEKAYNEGKSKVHYPYSKHNHSPSLAVDVAPYEQTGIDWSREQCLDFAGYVKGVADCLYRIGSITHRIRRGIDWNNDNDIDDNTFDDIVHFEIILNENEKK